MYFDDIEVGKLEIELGKRSYLETRFNKSIMNSSSIRKSHSCTDFNDLPFGKQMSKFTPVSLMCYAVVARDVKLLNKLVHIYPTAVNELTVDGVSALHLAALDGSVEMLKTLIGVNANINIMDSEGRSVLDYAVMSGQFDASQYLIKCGSDLSRVRDGLVY